MVYFNEYDKIAAQWIRELYPKAHVDERSIHDVKAEDLGNFERVHLFGGIAGWEYALELAGGPKDGECGLAPAPANPILAQENNKVTKILETSGPKCSGSLESAILTRSLANKLQHLLGMGGSMEYQETWREKVTPLGRVYWEHTASARRISDKDCTGWPTPNTDDRPNKNQGRNLGARVEEALAGWPTPMSGSPATETYNEAGNTDSSRKTVESVGWRSPRLNDYKGGVTGTKGSTRKEADYFLPDQVSMLVPLGATISSSNAETGKPVVYRLNAKFTLWLMGYPSRWAAAGMAAQRCCVARGTR